MELRHHTRILEARALPILIGNQAVESVAPRSLRVKQGRVPNQQIEPGERHLLEYGSSIGLLEQQSDVHAVSAMKLDDAAFMQLPLTQIHDLQHQPARGGPELSVVPRFPLARN